MQKHKIKYADINQQEKPEPTEVEQDRDNFFLEQRIVWLEGLINEDSISNVLKYLIYWNDKSKNPVTIYINSEGGDTSSGMAIIDAMDNLKENGIDVITIACGECASMASIILANGTKGLRYCTKNSRIMIHNSYYDDIDGHIESIDTCKKELEITNKTFSTILAAHSTMSVSWFYKKLEKDFYMSAIDAQKIGIIDNIGFPNLQNGGINDN